MLLLWENIVLAVNSLLSNKMRALLTMLGIIIGIGSVIAIFTVGDSLTLSVSENMQSMGANDVYVTVESKDEKEDTSKIDGIKYGSLSANGLITEDDYITEEMIKEMSAKFEDEIYAINLQISMGSTSVEYGKKSAGINITGVSLGYFVTNSLDFVAGNLFSETEFEEGKNVILVSEKLVEDLFEGDTKKALGKELEITINNVIEKFSISGVYKSRNNAVAMQMSMMGSGASEAYIPLKTATRLQHRETKYPYMQISTKVGVNSDELSAKIEKFLEPYYRTNRNCKVSAFTISAMVSMLTDMLSTITLAISIVAGIALIVGGIGVMNIMLVSITERTREIGTRKALGATNGSIRVQFIVEAMIICMFGGIIGILLGVSGGMFASNLLGYPAKPSVSGIFISLIFSMSIGVFFGYYPANKAAKMNPIDALRYE